MNDFEFLTVKNDNGRLAIRRKSSRDLTADSASAVTRTVTGDPALIPDGAADRLFRRLEAEVGFTQSGSGTPAENNVRRITGRTGAVLKVFGGNLYGEERAAVGKWIGSDGSLTDSADTKVSDFIPVADIDFIWFSGRRTAGAGTVSTKIVGYDASKAVLMPLYMGSTPEEGIFGTCATSGAAYIRIATAKTVSDILVADYHTERSASAVFPEEAGTVYGGTLDFIRGTLTVDRAYLQLDGTEEWDAIGSNRYFYLDIGEYGSVVNDSGVSSHFDAALVATSNTNVGQRIVNSSSSTARLVIRPTGYAGMSKDAFKAWLAGQAQNGTPVQVVYRLTEPVVYTVPAAALAVFGWQNAVRADCGAVTLEYVRDTAAAIEEGDASVRAMIAASESGFTASRNYTAGEFLTIGAALYRVTANIANGGGIAVGTNVAETTVGEQLALLRAALNL